MLDTLARPTDITDSEFVAFMRYAVKFFLHAGKLWRKDDHGKHKLVATQSPVSPSFAPHTTISRIKVSCYGYADLRAILVASDASRHRLFIRTCKPCQLVRLETYSFLQSLRHQHPYSLKYTSTRCTFRNRTGTSISFRVDFPRSLRRVPQTSQRTAITLGDWLFKDILCRWVPSPRSSQTMVLPS